METSIVIFMISRSGTQNRELSTAEKTQTSDRAETLPNQACCELPASWCVMACMCTEASASGQAYCKHIHTCPHGGVSLIGPIKDGTSEWKENISGKHRGL